MTLAETLAKAGWAMVPIYLCSIAALAVFIYKLFQLRAARLGDTEWLESALESLAHGDIDRCREKCASAVHPGARVMEAALATLADRPDRAEAEAARVGSLQLQQLDEHLTLLAFIAQVAPLLGLLGTVLGLLDLFLDLQAEQIGASASTLSAGIWKALLTTAAGLIVAVPALAGHTYLTSRTDALRLLIHDGVERLLTRAPVRKRADAP